ATSKARLAAPLATPAQADPERTLPAPAPVPEVLPSPQPAARRVAPRGYDRTGAARARPRRKPPVDRRAATPPAFRSPRASASAGPAHRRARGRTSPACPDPSPRTDAAPNRAARLQARLPAPATRWSHTPRPA